MPYRSFARLFEPDEQALFSEVSVAYNHSIDPRDNVGIFLPLVILRAARAKCSDPRQGCGELLPEIDQELSHLDELANNPDVIKRNPTFKECADAFLTAFMQCIAKAKDKVHA